MRYLFLFCSTLLIAADSSLCDGGDSARRELRRWQSERDLGDRGARAEAIDALAKRYPDAMPVQLARISFYHYESPAQFPALRQELVRLAEANPNDPKSLTLAASALYRHKTPQAIELARRAMRAQSGYPWAALYLASMQASGKFENKEEAKTSFEIFVEACPLAVEETRGFVSRLSSQATVARAAKQLRSWLEQQSHPDDLRLFEQLWGMEFRTTPAPGHLALRQKIAGDLTRMIDAYPKPDVMYLWLLRNGAKQAELPDLVAKLGERINTEYPRSVPAWSMAYEQWRKDIPEPKDHKDTAAWDAWRNAYATAMKKWADQYTDARDMVYRYVAAANDAHLLEKKELIAHAEKMLQERRSSGELNSGALVGPADLLLNRGWSDLKLLAWLKEAWPLAEEEDRRGLEDDVLPDSERQYFIEYGARADTAQSYLQTLIALGQKEVPESIRAFVSAPPSKENPQYYRNLALLAHAEQRKSDALAYYQAALLARNQPAPPWRGRVRDRILDEAKALFFANGGTEAAFALWSKPREPKQENAQGHWTKPAKPLPPFELADLQGKTWKLKQLEGRSVLINLWATWCGPCRAELPRFQELYEKTRERTDIQVLTFNIDEDLGLVAPFMKENKFSFPVLFAHSFTFGLLDGIGIPQNWLVDAKGNWIWTQLGFDAADPDWAGTMIRKLELARDGR